MLFVYLGFSRSEIEEDMNKKISNPGIIETLTPSEDGVIDTGLDFFIDSAPLFSDRKRMYIPCSLKTFPLIESSLQKMKASLDEYVIVTDSLTAPQKKIFTKEKIDIVIKKEEKEGVKKSDPNIFRLLDLVSARDKKNVWIELELLRQENMTPESIIPLLLWQIKLIIIARFSGEKNIPETIAKSFPLSKAGRATQYSKEELLALYEALMTAFNESRKTSRDLFSDLEKILLTHL